MGVIHFASEGLGLFLPSVYFVGDSSDSQHPTEIFFE